MIKVFKSIILLIIFVSVFYVFMFRTNNPELTEMQIFLKTWFAILIQIVMFILFIAIDYKYKRC